MDRPPARVNRNDDRLGRRPCDQLVGDVQAEAEVLAERAEAPVVLREEWPRRAVGEVGPHHQLDSDGVEQRRATKGPRPH